MNYCSKEQQANIVYYRPPWTCGRYDVEHRVALFYNLLEGMSYFLKMIVQRLLVTYFKSSATII